MALVINEEQETESRGKEAQGFKEETIAEQRGLCLLGRFGREIRWQQRLVSAGVGEERKKNQGQRAYEGEIFGPIKKVWRMKLSCLNCNLESVTSAARFVDGNPAHD